MRNTRFCITLCEANMPHAAYQVVVPLWRRLPQTTQAANRLRHILTTLPEFTPHPLGRCRWTSSLSSDRSTACSASKPHTSSPGSHAIAGNKRILATDWHVGKISKPRSCRTPTPAIDFAAPSPAPYPMNAMLVFRRGFVLNLVAVAWTTSHKPA